MACCGGRKLLEQGRQLQGQPSRTAAGAQRPTDGRPAVASNSSAVRELLRKAPQRPSQTPGTRQRAAPSAEPPRFAQSPAEPVFGRRGAP